MNKIGLTTDSYIASQRKGDFDARVADLHEYSYDGLLFVPRPARWPMRMEGSNLHNSQGMYRALNSLISLV